MKILVVGGGGREHTLAWKLAQSQNCTKLYAAPFTFYRVRLVVAGSEAAAAPPAFPLADAGNAAENFFVAPAPRGSDGGGGGGGEW